MATATKAKKVWKSIARQDLERWNKEGRAKTEVIGLSHIKLDYDFQARVEVNQDHVRSLCGLIDIATENGTDAILALAHIVIFRCRKSGRLIVADGFHRVLAYRKKGFGDIRAWVIESDEAEHEARLYCASANLEMSLPVTREDKAKAIVLLLSDPECFTWSDSEIGRRCGVSQGTVGTTRGRYCLARDISLPEKVKAFRDGEFIGWGTYKKLSNPERLPSIKRERNHKQEKIYFSARLGNRKEWLGACKDKEEAKQRLSDRVQEIKEQRPNFSIHQQMEKWLIRRGILCELPARDESRIGCVVSSQAIFVLLPDLELATIKATICDLFLLKKSFPDRRLVAVGYIEDHKMPRCSSLIALASQPPDPIEFMTPEEVVAEFGPKGEAGA